MLAPLPPVTSGRNKASSSILAEVQADTCRRAYNLVNKPVLAVLHTQLTLPPHCMSSDPLRHLLYHRDWCFVCDASAIQSTIDVNACSLSEGSGYLKPILTSQSAGRQHLDVSLQWQGNIGGLLFVDSPVTRGTPTAIEVRQQLVAPVARTKSLPRLIGGDANGQSLRLINQLRVFTAQLLSK